MRSITTAQGEQAPQRPRPARAACISSLRKRGAKRSFGGIVSVRARPRRTSAALTNRSSQVDVGEQPAVDVAPLDPEDQAHPPPLDQAMVEGRGLRAEALHRRVGLDRLRRVDADVADVLDSPVDPRLDRVAVDDAGDEGDGLRRSLVLAALPGPHDQQSDDQQQHHASQLTALPGTSHSYLSRWQEIVSPRPYGMRRTLLSNVSLIGGDDLEGVVPLALPDVAAEDHA